MTEKHKKLSPKLPSMDWKSATCEVCGEVFEYFGKKRPHTCKNGDCRYRYEHQIEPKTWASYQPNLFDKIGN